MSRDELVATQEGSLLWTLEEIGRLASESGDPSETLTNIVHLIQRRFETDVCSVYLLEPDLSNLVLATALFRAFDIWKPYPIRKLERLPNGVGVMADDLLAGVYANVAVQLSAG